MRNSLSTVSLVMMLMYCPFAIASDAIPAACRFEASNIARAIGGQVKEGGNNMVPISANGASEITYGCLDKEGDRFLALFKSPNTLPSDFYQLAAKAGAVITGLRVDMLQTAMQNCVQAATQRYVRLKLDATSTLDCGSESVTLGNVKVSIENNARQSRR